jgi:hypothetical protein
MGNDTDRPMGVVDELLPVDQGLLFQLIETLLDLGQL